MNYASAYDTVNTQDRTTFIQRTYGHLALAIGAFVGLEYWLLQQPWALKLAGSMTGHWWMVLIAFVGVSWLANWWAHSDTAPGVQYLGLGLYVVAEAFILLPLILFAQMKAPDTLVTAGYITGGLFAGLTAVVLLTGKDFSFLRIFLMVGGFVALGLIVTAMLFGFTLGWMFSAAMIVLCSGSILYNTSNVMRHYGVNQYVAASLALFASIATLFYYVLRLLLAFRSN
ncbi:MAG: Bax inhibitor-1 family protein [Verrucomicrobiales bacterium]